MNKILVYSTTIISLIILLGCSNDKRDEPEAIENKITKHIGKDLLIYIEDEEGNNILPCSNDFNNLYFDDCYAILYDKYGRQDRVYPWQAVYPYPRGNTYHVTYDGYALNENHPILEHYYKVYGSSEWLNITLKYSLNTEYNAHWCIEGKILPFVICTEDDKGPLNIISGYPWEQVKYSIVYEVSFVRHADGSHTVKKFEEEQSKHKSDE